MANVEEIMNMTAEEFQKELESDVEVTNLNEVIQQMKQDGSVQNSQFTNPNDPTVVPPSSSNNTIINSSIGIENDPNKVIGKNDTSNDVIKNSSEEIKEVNNSPNDVIKKDEETTKIKEDNKPIVNNEGFNNTSKPVPNTPKEVTEQKKMEKTNEFNPKDFIKNITVDLNNIQLGNVSPIDRIDNVNFLMNNKSKQQIAAIQSGYLAYVEGLNYDEINVLINSTLDEYGTQLLLAQTVHKMINSTNIGNISFDEWKKITSFYDLDSFLYGIYLQTFPGDTKFQVTCGTCENTIDVIVNNDTLISAKNDNTYRMLEMINTNQKSNPQLSLQRAVIHNQERVFLEDSKIIMEIKLPTIEKHLNLLASTNQKAKEKSKHLLTMLLFIEHMYVLDVKRTIAEKKACYYEETNKQEIINIIKRLSYNDADKASVNIQNMIDMYKTVFKIKSFICPKCQTRINDIDIDMETLLFFQILR